MPGANAESRIFVSETETVSNGVLALRNVAEGSQIWIMEVGKHVCIVLYKESLCVV